MDPAGFWYRFSLLPLSILAVSLPYFAVTSSVVSTWASSVTFSHGFLIIPISLYLLYVRMPALMMVEVTADWRAVFVLPLIAVAELLFHAAGVVVLQQLAILAMVWSFVWLVSGRDYCRAAWFPLAYLIFCVPIGEALVPFLMGITADATIWMIELWGIPVYREGVTFSIPGGRFEVARACSGIRYLIASLALGTVFAQLAYSQLSKKLLFVGLAILIPIVANILRAFAIVLIAWYSDMQLATGVDHLLYGWVFFGIVLALMFGIGTRFADVPADREFATTESDVLTRREVSKTRLSASLPVLVGFLTLVVASNADQLLPDERATGMLEQRASHLPTAPPNWSLQTPIRALTPVTAGADQQISVSYRSNKDEVVSIVAAYYSRQRQGAELVGFGNNFGDATLTLDEHIATIHVEGGNARVRRVWLETGTGRLRVHYWYLLGSKPEVSPWRVKFYQLGDAIRSAETSGHIVFVATPWDGLTLDGPGPDLEFLRVSYSLINACLSSSETASACSAQP